MRRQLLAAVAGMVAAVLACSDDGSTEAFCETAETVAADNPAAVFGAYEPSDPASARDGLVRAAAQLRRLAAKAPGEVEGDIDHLADVAERFAEVLSGDDPEAVERGLRALEPDLDDVGDASSRVVGYARTACDVDLDPAEAGPG